LQVAQDSAEKANVDVENTSERLRVLGGNLEHPAAIVDIHAPASGVITDQQVTNAGGIAGLSSPNPFTISDLSNVWILCDVYENDLAQVHVGDRAQIELNAYPGRKFTGRIANIGKLLDPNTRAAKVRIELPNTGGLFRTNMFATVHFRSEGSQMRTVIPASAVLRLQDRDWVFVKADGNRFRRLEIHAGPVNSDGTEQVLGGLRAGEQVVRDALLFDREAKKE